MRFSISKRRPQPGGSLGTATARRPQSIVLLPKPVRPAGIAPILMAESLMAEKFSLSFDALLDRLDVASIWERLENGDFTAIFDLFDWFEFDRTVTEAITPEVKSAIQFEGRKSYDEVRLGVDSGIPGRGPSASGTSPPKLPPTTFADPPPDAPGPRGGFYATTRFDMSNPFAIRQAESFAADLVREISNTTRRSIKEAVTDAFRNGTTVDELARSLRNTIGLTSAQARAVESYRERLLNGGMELDRAEALTRRYWRKTRNRRAQTIARTEIMKASNYGRLQGWLSASDVGMLDANTSVKEWVSTSTKPSFDPTKPETCPICAPMDGVKVMGLETEFSMPSGKRVLMPPAHPNCFPAGTMVFGPRVIGSVVRWYEGEVVQLETKNGVRLAVTPNHPLLTPEGWVAAGLLDEGDGLICHVGHERMTSPVDPHDHQVPARIEQVAEAFGEPGCMSARVVPCAAEDFHGDGIGSEVSVVRTDGLLRDGRDASIPQHVSEHAFSGAAADTKSLSSGSASDKFLGASSSAADGGVSGLGVASILDGSPTRSRELVRLRPAATNNTLLDEDSTDRDAADAVALADRLLGLTGEVELDQLVDVRRVPFRGHVYNLQTVEEWYTANTVISHNCRCTAVVWPPEPPEDWDPSYPHAKV